MNSTIYVSECLVCHEDTGFDTPEAVGTCSACSPHVCTPELPGDDWCDWCGRDI